MRAGRRLSAAMRLYKDRQNYGIWPRRAAGHRSGAHRRAMETTRSAPVLNARPGPELPPFTFPAFRCPGGRVPFHRRARASALAWLHYRGDEQSPDAQPSDLLLIDAGCEFDGYASDITRHVPGGREGSADRKGRL